MIVSPNKMLILDDDWVKDAPLITASSFVGEYVPTNVVHPTRDERWVTTDPLATLSIYLGATVPIQAIFLGFHGEHGLPTGGTIRLRLDGEIAIPGEGLLYDSGPIALNLDPRFGTYLHLLPSELQVRYMHLAYALSGAESYALSFFKAGPPWQPADNYSLGAEETFVDPTEFLRTVGGSLHPDHRPGWRAWSLALELMPKADRDWLRDLSVRKGRYGQFVFCRNPAEAASETAVCRFAEDVRLARSAPLHHDAPLQIEELI
jgi:hypothetical protein